MSTDTGVDPANPGYLLNIDKWQPTDAHDFGILLSAYIGLEESEGSDLFYFMVCTPQWLAREIQRDAPPFHEPGYVYGRHYIFVPEWDFPQVHTILSDLAKQTEGPDWISIAQKLSRFGHWEFEDYRQVRLPRQGV
jgi:hypothetical protein